MNELHTNCQAHLIVIEIMCDKCHWDELKTVKEVSDTNFLYMYIKTIEQIYNFGTLGRVSLVKNMLYKSTLQRDDDLYNGYVFCVMKQGMGVFTKWSDVSSFIYDKSTLLKCLCYSLDECLHNYISKLCVSSVCAVAYWNAVYIIIYLSCAFLLFGLSPFRMLFI